ncbi:hypothetical protein E2C01_044228 [Portunus trituberculatus]|uniref:Uncharacterized protein n=1 Tax=Portunus trituberculatus TaxID=210409 RepID=A0A5B7FRI8_PORTR|nr:hypothetical protein [Portunus trituberculatus]
MEQDRSFLFSSASEPDHSDSDYEEEIEESEDSSSEDSENDSEDPLVFSEQREDRDSGDGEQTPNIVLRTQSGSRRHKRASHVLGRRSRGRVCVCVCIYLIVFT